MTPAEKIAKRKKPKAINRQKAVWICRLKEVREKLGLTLRDVEAETGVFNSTISCAERGADVTLDTARKLADFFGMTIEAIWPKRIA